MPLNRAALGAGLQAMMQPLAEMLHGVAHGLRADVHAFLVPHIEAQIRALARREHG